MSDNESPWVAPDVRPRPGSGREAPSPRRVDSFVEHAAGAGTAGTWPESPFETLSGSPRGVEGAGGPRRPPVRRGRRAAVDRSRHPPTGLPRQHDAASRNPWVGHAQRLLNVFLEQLRAGTAAAPTRATASKHYIVTMRARLAGLRQDPLVLDCSFGRGDRGRPP